MTGTSSMNLQVTVEADTEQLARLRDRVVEAAEVDGADPDTVRAFELVVSELATNVIHHTNARTLTTVFANTPQAWVLDVSNAEDLVDLDHVALPSDQDISGRGLAIVAALMDAVVLVDVGDEQHIRCFKYHRSAD